MKRPNPESKGGRVLAVLADGPATTGEVAIELDWPVRLTCAHLRELMIRGHATREPFPTGNRLRRFVWSVVEASRA